MLDHVLSLATARGMVALNLNVMPTNVAAISFYKVIGFMPDERRGDKIALRMHLHPDSQKRRRDDQDWE